MLSEHTWDRLRDGHVLNISQGEETITDSLLLEISRLDIAGITILKTPKALESKTGTDWEWWIGSDMEGWRRYGVQAKRLNVQHNRYTTLHHKIHGVPQLDLLLDYCNMNNAIPLYCLYNYTGSNNLGPVWNCCQSINPKQLGCTITTPDVIRSVLSHGPRSFEEVHKNCRAMPWRCLFCRQPPTFGYSNPNEDLSRWHKVFFDQNMVYKSLPIKLVEARVQGRIGSFSEENLSSMVPKRIMIVDTSTDTSSSSNVDSHQDSYKLKPLPATEYVVIAEPPKAENEVEVENHTTLDK